MLTATCKCPEQRCTLPHRSAARVLGEIPRNTRFVKTLVKSALFDRFDKGFDFLPIFSKPQKSSNFATNPCRWPLPVIRACKCLPRAGPDMIWVPRGARHPSAVGIFGFEQNPRVVDEITQWKSPIFDEKSWFSPPGTVPRSITSTEPDNYEVRAGLEPRGIFCGTDLEAPQISPVSPPPSARDIAPKSGKKWKSAVLTPICPRDHPSPAPHQFSWATEQSL